MRDSTSSFFNSRIKITTDIMERERYTEEEMDCIKKLKERMDGYMPKHMQEDNNLFSRFLKARNYDLDAAELMLKNNLHWRKVNNIDSLLSDYKPSEVAVKYISFSNIGYSKEGYPISFCKFGNIDFKGVLKVLKKQEVITHLTHCFETDISKMKIKSKEIGREITKFIYIFDLSNFSLAMATYKPCLDIIIRLFTTFDANYPERLKCAYLINASFYFTLFWSVVSPFLAGETFKKIKIYGKSGWESDMLQEIDKSVIPAYIGGTRTDPDGNPLCETIVSTAGPVPEKYFTVKDNTFRKSSTTKKLVVHRCSKEVVEIQVENPGSVLEWEFDVKNRDIGFALLFKDDKNVDAIPKEVVPLQRIDTNLFSETGLFRCEKAGTYILVFDNTYSWMLSKDVYYTASILKPDQVITDL